jgi:hypothetical protein
VLWLRQIWTYLQQGLVRFRQTFEHVVAVTDIEAFVHFAKTLLHGFRVEPKTVEPDVVLGQAHVDVECVVFFGALQKRLDYSGRTNKAGLVVRVG